MKKDFIFTMRIDEKDLCEQKRPPLCDSCSDPMPFDEDHKVYVVNALVLEGSSIWGLLCDSCKKSFGKVAKLDEKTAPKEAKHALRGVLARPAVFLVF